MRLPIFWGNVKNGKLVIHDQQRLKEYLAGIKGEVEITIKRWRPNRTLNQNAYYWAVCLALVADHTGFDPEEVHQIFEKKFLAYQKPYKGKRYWFYKRCSSLNTAEFGEYLEKIIRFAGQELGVEIPQPNEIIPKIGEIIMGSPKGKLKWSSYEQPTNKI